MKQDGNSAATDSDNDFAAPPAASKAQKAVKPGSSNKAAAAPAAKVHIPALLHLVSFHSNGASSVSTCRCHALCLLAVALRSILYLPANGGRESCLSVRWKAQWHMSFESITQYTSLSQGGAAVTHRKPVASLDDSSDDDLTPATKVRPVAQDSPQKGSVNKVFCLLEKTLFNGEVCGTVVQVCGKGRGVL